MKGHAVLPLILLVVGAVSLTLIVPSCRFGDWLLQRRLNQAAAEGLGPFDTDVFVSAQRGANGYLPALFSTAAFASFLACTLMTLAKYK